MPPIDIQNSASSPGSLFSIRTQNRDFNTQALTTEEASLLDSQFNTLINDFDNRVVTDLFRQRSALIGKTAAHAKQILDEKRFGGINAADNEIAFDVIRPGHIRADPSDGSSQNDWYFEPDSAGWNDWIGDGTSGNDYTVPEDQITLVLGVVDQDASSAVSSINVDRFGRNVDMLPKDMNSARLTDNENNVLAQALPTLVATENDRVHIRLRSDVAKESQPRLVGVTFGVGDYMNQEDY
jgi:hypothetical protein